MTTTLISITELAQRAGVASSALRFYEEKGLIRSVRAEGTRRMFPKEVLRRVAFIRAAQQVGLSLQDIQAALASLPQQRTPTKQDWEKLSRSWRPLLEQRIASLCKLRDQLSTCIGCGCLSLKSCALYNQNDVAAERDSGAQYLIGKGPAQATIVHKQSKNRLT